MQKLYTRVLAVAGSLALLGGWLSPGAQAQSRAAAPYFRDDATAARSALGAALRRSRPLTLDAAGLRTALAAAPAETRAGARPLTLALPLPDGSSARFAVVATELMAPALAAQFPQIRTYRGTGLDDPEATLRLDMTPQGFHAQILSRTTGTVYIDPATRGDQQHVLSFYQRDMNRAAAGAVPACQFKPSAADLAALRQRTGSAQRTLIATGPTLRTYRLAVAATGEYTAFQGGTVALAQAAIVTTINRVVGVYEREVAVRLQLVGNNNQIIYTNAGTDPYTNGNPGTMITQAQTNITSVIGTANFDIGHVFGTNSGGLAGMGVVCNATNKARGVTGSGAPVGDAFDIDYVAHEVGHQFGANHTFNSPEGACTDNGNPSTAMEPGSGSTIMAYAGICDADDLQNNSDAYFHTISFQEIASFVATTSCGTSAATGNSAPTVTAPATRTLPIGTPFRLTATATDPEGDALTYCWEQVNVGPFATLTAPQTANQNVPLFRSFTPTTSPTRYFPRLNTVISNGSDAAERLPTVTRTLSFRCTARDQHNGAAGVVGGVNYSATLNLPVTSAAGPFLVTAPNTALTWTGGSTQTVTWSVAGTNANGVNCASVNILLSTDGGLTYPTTLASGVANDGSQAITVPNVNTTTARLMVAAADNYFFDISNANFSITAAAACNAPTSLSVGSITQTTASVSFTASASATGYTVTTTPATTSQSVTASPVSLTGLTPGTAYTVSIVSNCAAGATSTAATATFTTTSPPPCNAPTGLAAGSITSNSASISFTPNGTSTNYTVTTFPATSTQTVTASPVTLTGLSAATNYTVSIVGNCANGVTSAPGTLDFATRVANDECATAISLVSGTSCSYSSGTVTGATQSLAPSNCSSSTSSSAFDVWYSFVATGPQHTITANSGFDGVLQVFSGSCGSLTALGCRDQTSAGDETLTFNTLTSGTRYYVRYYPYTAGSISLPADGRFNICVTGPVAPSCNAPTALTASSVTTTSASVSFTASPFATGYTVTTTPATTSQSVTASPVTLTGLAPATNYTVNIVSNCAGGATSSAATVALTTRPTNDECAGALGLTPTAACTTVSGSVNGATQSQAPSTCSSRTSASALDVWYKFTATSTTHLVEVNSNFNAVLQVFSGSCGSLTSLACADRDAPVSNEVLTLSFTPGTEYYVRVYPFGATAPANGSFTICVQTITPVCSAPTNLSVGSITQTTASVSFTASASATGYTVTTTPATTTQNVTASPVSLSGLTPGTAYTVNIASNCAGSTTSPAATTSFSTAATPVTAAPVLLTPANGSVTNNNRPVYSGTAPANSTVTVFVDGTSRGTTTTDAAGNWTLTPPTPLADGPHQTYATAQLSGQGLSGSSNTNSFTVDTTPPAAPTVALPANGSVTNDNTPNYAGLADAGSTLTVVVDGTPIGTTTATAGGVWTFTPSTPLADGTHTVRARASDPAGNTSVDSNTNTFVVDTTPPQPPLVILPANGSRTNDNTPLYTGTAEPGSTVTVLVDGVSIGTTASNGNWSFIQPTALADGAHTVRVRATDGAGNTSFDSGTNTFTVDTVAPTVTISSSAGASGSSTSTSPIPFTVTFSESVTGFADTDVTVGNGVVTAGSFGGSGTTYSFTVTPAAAGNVTVSVAANAAQDAAGNGNTAAGPFSLSYAAPATASIWTGAVSTDWYTAANWTAGVPSASLDATIPGNAPRMPLIGAGTASARNLSIASGATLNQSGGTLDVRADLTNDGTFEPMGGTVVLGTTALSNGPNILGSARVRFWNLTVNANGVLLSTSAGASVRRLLTLDGTLVTQGNSFILESDVNNTALVVNNGGVVFGAATAQRYITPDLNAGPGYRHVSAPTGNATVSSLATTGFSPVVNPAYNSSATPTQVAPFPTVFGYEQSRLSSSPASSLSAFDKGWVSPAGPADALTAGKGYTVNMPANQTLSFTGPLNNGTIAQTLVRNSDATAADAGWQLVGNPYPSPLNYSLVAPADRPGLDAAMYVYESTSQYGGGYRSYINGVGNPVLPLGQAFFVRVAEGQTSGALTLRNSQRVTGYQNPVFHRTTETRPFVQLTLKPVGSSSLTDDLYVYFEQGATDGFDSQYDAAKLSNPSGLNLSSSLSTTQRLAIDGRAPLGTAQRVVPLAVGVPAAGSYTLDATQLLNLGTVPTQLRDLQTGALIDLAQQPSYQFTVSNASALITGRFELVFSPQRPTATTGAAALQLRVWPNPVGGQQQLNLTLSQAVTGGTVTLRDVLGRTVATQPLSGIRTSLPTTGLATGTYLLHVTAPGHAPVTRRVVVE
jgi:hypothetical protein